MIVFVLDRLVDWEGEEPLGTFATRELAEEERRHYLTTNNLRHDEHLKIYEVEVIDRPRIERT